MTKSRPLTIDITKARWKMLGHALRLDENTKVDGFGSGAIRLGLGIGYGNTTSTGSVTDAHGLRWAIRLIPATVRPRRHQSAPFKKTHGNTEAKNPFLKTAL